MGGFICSLADMRREHTYIGVTNNLVRRVCEHRERLIEEHIPDWRDLWDEIVK